jgi:IS5 family transposase
MKPKKMRSSGQKDLFRSRLEQMINRKHPLCKLADEIDWRVFEEEFGVLYVEKVGRPGLPIRLMVGLQYLKYTYNESDESVVERFLENPYWQYFCGYEYFQHEFPLDTSSLVRWRKRVGAEGMEKLLKETIESAKRKKLVREQEVKRVNVDTTVQEKAIAFPTDARLYYKMLQRLVRVGKEAGIGLRQSYRRLSKKALARQGRYAHAKQMKRAKKETRKLKTYLGRLLWEIEKKSEQANEKVHELLELAKRLYRQKREDKGKLYSIHAPEVECISKGKAHKRYEFGCKVRMVTTSKGNWILGIDAIPGNPYDGHTLKASIEQATKIAGWQPNEAYCDKGYRGSATIEGTTIQLTNRKKKSVSRWGWKWFKRRSAIEPIFGHLKSDNKLDRNHLKGKEGDRINAILAGCGFNMRKLLRAFFLLIIYWLKFGRDTEMNSHFFTKTVIPVS